MAEFKVGRRKSSVGNAEPAALTQDSVAITRDSILQWKLEGKVFFAQFGDAATKEAFVETTYDEDQPSWAMRVPEGTLMIPLALNVTLEDLAGTESHAVWSKTDNDIGDGTSTSVTPVNYRRDNKAAPTVKVAKLYSGDATAATGLVEVKRFYRPFASAAVTDGFNLHDCPWSINDPDMPLLLGPATLQLHVIATTTDPEGYMECTWVELDADEMGL